MKASSNPRQILVLFAISLILLMVAFLPIEDAVALMVMLVALGCGAALLLFVADVRERRWLFGLFAGALLLRVAFTFLCYKSGIIQFLGGADDEVWRVCWSNSRAWMGLSTSRNNRWVPDTIAEIYSTTNSNRNTSYAYWGTYFYYLLNVRSQIALAVVNCFFSALTCVIIYLSARLFFSRDAARFVALVAVVFPNFLIWSALTIKEPALILLEIIVFYFFVRAVRERNLLFGFVVITGIFIVVGLRFYVAYFLAASCLSMIFVTRSATPRRSALVSVITLAGVLFLANSLGLVSLNVADIARAQLDEMTRFRENVSSGIGSNTGVSLDYDIRTPMGGVMMVITGATYVLLSPFPWQFASGKQAVALPDVLFWWYLVFWFIVPGAIYCWRQRPAVSILGVAFILPLLLFYSLIFGNVGLAYRQRAQMMPFFLLFAAAGYERRRIKRRQNLLISGTNNANAWQYGPHTSPPALPVARR